MIPGAAILMGGFEPLRVDLAVAAVRRWELEAELLRGYHLTLPPETEPLDEGRGEGQTHVRWKERKL